MTVEREKEHEFILKDEEVLKEEIVEISDSIIREHELNLNSIILGEKATNRNEDRAITLPLDKMSPGNPKKSTATSLKDTSKSKQNTDTLPIEPEISKHMTNGASKSFSLSKSYLNQKELVDIQGPISSEIFFSSKNTPILNDYQIGKLLGEGSYGQVKLVRHIRTNVERAMKVIMKAGVPEAERLIMMKEVSILKSLDHPNIIKIFDLYEDDSKIYIITE